jgi:release factor glutamine methyltransferase
VNLRQGLAHARRILAEIHIEDASLEGEILLRHVLGMDRTQLYARLDLQLSHGQEETLNELLERRCRGEPSAYITGHREFYGLDFRVDHNVLIPRPETELLVEIAIKLAQKHPILKIADIGTGCGAIAISLAVNLPQSTVYAIDISAAALEVACNNCRRHSVGKRVILRRGDLLGPLDEPVNMIVANLPYVRETDISQSGPLSYEPALALNGGKGGLAKIEILCRQAAKKLDTGGFLLLETGEGQAKKIVDILCKAFPAPSIEVHKDLAGIERVVSLRLI